MAALKGEPHDSTPVWFMRQAGRYMPGYIEVRRENSIKQICRDIDLTLRVTAEPLEALGVDAAIIFSDITIPLEAMGFNLDFREGVGPVISNPFRDNRSLEGIHDFSVSSFEYGTFDAIRKFKEKNPAFPIIGFSGGPLTIASYLVSGKPDRDLKETKSLLYNEDPEFLRLLDMVREMVITNCREQVKNGADAIQIFDSWSGFLPPAEFRKYSARYLKDIQSELSPSTRIIYFSTQTGGMLDELEHVGFDFLSLDWRVDLPSISAKLDSATGLQGNLDPAMVSGSPDRAIRESGELAAAMRGRDNYIFNLGHGVLPDTKPAKLKEIVRTVHQSGKRS